MQARPEDRIAGRYRLVRPIARGGMAEVWQAHDETLDRAVAVKILHAHLANDRDFIERFRREAVAVAKLNHPNVVTVYDTGVETLGNGERRAYIVMELLRGATLRTLMNGKQGEPPTPREAVRVAIEVGEGLSYAHRNGVIHRDVKPANIFVEALTNPIPSGSRLGRVRVVDFGIAKGVGSQNDEDLTKIGSILGTAKYVSPEQVEGRPVDARSDVYALGVVLYEMITGRPPFVGANDMATALQHVRETLTPARAWRPDINPQLDNIIAKALMKDPNGRHPDAASLVNDLRQLDPAKLTSTDYSDPYVTPAVTRTEADRTPPRGIPSESDFAPTHRPSDFAPNNDPTNTVAQGMGTGRDIRTGRATNDAKQQAHVQARDTTYQTPSSTGSDPTTFRTQTTLGPAVRHQVSNTSQQSTSPTRRRGKLVLVLLPLIGIASGTIVGIAGADRRPRTTSIVPLIRAMSFDPPGGGGDGREHEERLRLLYDKSQTSYWMTEQYGSRNFGERKNGVGTYIVLEKTSLIRQVEVTSSTPGWSARVYVRDSLPESLDGWGAPRSSTVEIPQGKSIIDVTPSSGTYVLLWITDLGPKRPDGYQVRITDIKVRG